MESAKNRLKEEGSQLVTNCHQLKMTAQNGKKRLTDVANTEQCGYKLFCHISDVYFVVYEC